MDMSPNPNDKGSGFIEWFSGTFLFTLAPIIFTAVTVFSGESNLTSDIIRQLLEKIFNNGSVVISSFSLVVPSIFNLFKRENSKKTFFSFSILLLIAFCFAAAYCGMTLNPTPELKHSLVISMLCFGTAIVVSASVEVNR